MVMVGGATWWRKSRVEGQPSARRRRSPGRRRRVTMVTVVMVVEGARLRRVVFVCGQSVSCVATN